MITRFLVLFFSVSLLSFYPQQLRRFIEDRDKVFFPEETQKLNDLYRKHERKTSNDIFLLTVHSYNPDNDIQEYAINIFKKYKFGKKGKNNGLLIVFCAPCLSIAIIPGAGTKRILSDSTLDNIIQKTMIPFFRKGEYFEGIVAGSNRMIEILEKPENEIK